MTFTPPAPSSSSTSLSSNRSSFTGRIQQFYDESSLLWEHVWGEHMHHGYYGPDHPSNSPQEAQRVLIEKLLDWSDRSLDFPIFPQGVQQGERSPQSLAAESIESMSVESMSVESMPLDTHATQTILDVGCGIGGSTLYLASKYRAEAVGITLSPIQAKRAGDRATAAGLGDYVTFRVADALAMPFADNSFDLVWSLESGGHMPDKTKFLQECCRVLKPGGRLIMATWCHRTPDPPLTPQEEQHLGHIYRLYHLPYVIALADYETIAQSLPLQTVHTADWSTLVAPFWQDVVQSALNPQVLWGILAAGWKTVEGAMAIPLMMEGYRTGLIRYGLLTGVKSGQG